MMDDIKGYMSAFRDRQRSVDRLREAGEHGAVVMTRQSTPEQVRENKGSQAAQRDYYTAKLLQIGVREEKLHLREAWGESGSAGKPRHQFEDICRLVRRREVRLIIVPDHHRLSRCAADSLRLFGVAREAGALFLVGDQMLDPSDFHDAMILGIFASLAEFDVASKSAWSGAARLALARRLCLRTRLPSGLCWASRSDPVFVERMTAAGLSSWLDVPVERYRARSMCDGVMLYPLPFPDEEVYATVRLRFRWLLTTRSLARVLERIHDGAEGYPRPGLTPECQIGRFRPDAEPVWRPADAGHLHRWFRSPALAGTYAVTLASQADPQLRALRRPRGTVRVQTRYMQDANRRLAPLPGAVALLAGPARNGVSAPSSDAPASSSSRAPRSTTT